MTGGTLSIVVLAALILVVTLLRAAQAIRADRGRERGSLPGSGHHVIDASYHSGGSGGGHSAQIKVPKDPQAYARSFVPRKDRT